MGQKCVRTLLTWACFVACAAAQCGKDHRDSNSSGILVTDVTISGTRTLSASELTRMTSTLTGSCFDEDLDEMSERVRALFQDRGFFQVDVKNVSLKASDPLANPKPVLLIADVDEGPRFRLGQITFLQNHAFSEDALRKVFPLKKGDLFTRTKVAGGMESLMKLYASHGYLESIAVPDTGISAAINLRITVTEGPQYDMGKLEILAEKDLADRLRLAWKLDEGQVFDSTYIDKYVEENRELLPSGFGRDRVELARDCPKALVAIRLSVTDNGASSDPMRNVPCEKKDDSQKKK